MSTVFKFDLFFDLSPDLLCIAGYDGFFKKVNKAVPQLLGYTEQELMSRPISEFIHPDDQEITAKQREKLTDSAPLYNFENRYLTKQGETVWLSWTSLPVESDQVIFAIAKHISHKKRLEAERNTLIANLLTTNENLKQLSILATHDLRSPLMSMLAIMEYIDLNKINDSRSVEIIEVLKTSGQFLKKSVDQYIDQLKEKYQNTQVFEKVPIQESLNNAIRPIQALIDISQTQIETDFSAWSHVQFNAAYMESIFLNLITNSIKYAKPKSNPEIKIVSRFQNNRPQIIFSDQGLGFDLTRVKDKIFEIHQSFHAHEDSKGIGLYLIKSHLQSYGGHIALESKPNKGATFTMTFLSQ